MSNEKKYVVYFKGGANVGIKATGWHIDAAVKIVFSTEQDGQKREVFVNTSEVLYIVPFDAVIDTPDGVK